MDWTVSVSRLRRFLSDPCATLIVVEFRGRLAWFGVGQVAAARGGRVVVAGWEETGDGVVRDLTRVPAGRCAGRFGRGGVRDRALCATGNVGAGLAA